MPNLKKKWQDHKEQIKTATVYVASSVLVYTYAVRRTKKDREIVWFKIDEGTDSPTGMRLYVRHQDGEEGSYAIND